MHPRPARFVSPLILLAGISSSLLAQGTGTIHGSVIDPTGAAVPGARVTATLEGQGLERSVETSVQGSYTLPLLPVGGYVVRVEGDGFKAFLRTNINLTSNENIRIDAKLAVGSVSEEVTVTATAPLVDSRSSQTGTLIDERRVVELPINGRNVVGLAALLPGATNISAPQTTTDDRGGPTVSISGSRTNQNLFLFDGSHNNGLFRNTGINYPPPDALQEVKVLTNSFSAEYGRNAGAVFNVVTRSGTNDFHGALWEFLRNHDLNARNFFAGSEIPKLIQNQFGAAVGGPIIRNRLFFFAAYEGLRIRPDALATSAFPLTAAERRGDFSHLARAITDPDTRQPFANNQIPASRFDTVANNVLTKGLMPLPNRPDGQLVETFSTPSSNENVLTRIDLHFGSHTSHLRYNFNRATSVGTGGQVPSYYSLNEKVSYHSATIGDTYAIRPNLLNDFRLSFYRSDGGATTNNPIHLTDLGGNMPIFGPKYPPLFQISGRLNLGAATGIVDPLINESYQIADSLHWIKGDHGVKTGVEFMKTRYLNIAAATLNGDFRLTGQLSGDPAADFLLGRPARMDLRTPMSDQGGIQYATYLYIQDDWRVRPRLTLNLGLRYEMPLPWFHENDYWHTFRPGQQSQVIPNAPVGMVYPGDPGIPRGTIATDKNNFVPRFGFVWDPFGNGRTSVRGSYGIYYEMFNADMIQNDGQPFRYTFTYQVPHSLTDPLRGQAVPPLTVNVKDPVFVGLPQLSYTNANTRTPYVQHFGLNVQRELLPNLALQVGYVGRVGRKGLLVLPGNPAVWRPGATLGNINARRIYPTFGNNREISGQANSSYNALQVEVQKRFSRGFSFQMAYAFSRSIDMDSGITTGIGNSPPDAFNLRTQWGLSEFFAKHVFSASWMWDLPRLESQPAAARWILGGWQINGLVTARTGFPLNVTNGADIALVGTTTQRPNVVGEHRLADNRPRGEQVLAWFNRAAFANPAAGTFGNVGRNALIGPGAFNTNMGLFKSFLIPSTERVRVQFRSEFFNLFNNVNLGKPNGALNAGANMGRITTADQARVIQFALKLLF
ncbi:MAG: TonB-dependent receptor [Bryobacterales bacterium]|nr:TonB-dependent receptor [Bryobacterales bacterium]